MLSFGGPRAETAADQDLYLSARLTEVACLDCLVRVLVKKNSEHHTSIQWAEDPQAHCTEFNRLASQPGGRRVHASCPRLRSSIERAVEDGRVQIGAQDGY